MKELVGYSSNHHAVYIDHDKTHIDLHIAETENLVELVKEVVQSSNLEGPHMAIEKDLGRVVGKTSLVATTDSDEIIYAKRKQRETYMRFVKGREMQSTSFVSVILDEDEQQADSYLVWSAWVGLLAPTTPGSAKEMPTSKVFWSNHALVEDERIIDESSITQVSPW